MRRECARPRALRRSLNPVESVAAKTIVRQICESGWQSGILTDFRVQMTVFHVMPSALFRFYLAP